MVLIPKRLSMGSNCFRAVTAQAATPAFDLPCTLAGAGGALAPRPGSPPPSQVTYTPTDEINQGGHGDIVRVRASSHGPKERDNRLVGKLSFVTDISTNEIAALERLKHVQGVIDVIDIVHPPPCGWWGASATQEQVMIVMKEYQYGDLFDLISSSKFPSHNAHLSLCILCKIVPIVHECHENGVLHLDIKPENIMLEKRPWVSNSAYTSERLDFHPILIDFGSALATGPVQSAAKWKGVGTYSYSAPECSRVVMQEGARPAAARRSGGYDDLFNTLNKADVWSLGALLYTVYFKDNIDPTHKGMIKCKNDIREFVTDPHMKCILHNTLVNYQDRWSITDLHKYVNDGHLKDRFVVF